MRTGIWTALPCMQEARAEFHPCEHQGLLYLCGNGSALIETFNPEACVFLPHTSTLPEKYSACITVVERNELLVISAHYLCRCTEVGQQMHKSQHPDCTLTCNLAPVLDSVNSLVYFIYEEACFSLNLDTCEKSLVSR